MKGPGGKEGPPLKENIQSKINVYKVTSKECLQGNKQRMDLCSQGLAIINEMENDKTNKK